MERGQHHNLNSYRGNSVGAGGTLAFPQRQSWVPTAHPGGWVGGGMQWGKTAAQAWLSMCAQ